MAKEMLINVSEGEECRIALIEDGRLEELYMERTSAASHVGSIYKGRVTNIEPSIQAAFVDFGLGRNGFLHNSDLMPQYFGHGGDGGPLETVGNKLSRRDRPPIQRCLRRGDELLVQVIKEGIGTKGPTLTSYLSIPGKMLVMMPGMAKMGVSKKIEDDAERRRLRDILDGLKPPKDVAFIIRTAGVGKSKLEIERDLKYLTRIWEQIEKKLKEPAPVELYTEGDLVTRTVRDVYTNDIDRVVIDNKEVAKRIKDVIKITAPRTKNKVDVYEGGVPLFHQAGIEQDIERMYSRHVPLPSGGSLVIDQTEAIVAIDVNSGKFREHADAETTAFKTDMEAADEICRQLRLRDLGGVIICDFIDLRYERHRRELEKRLDDNFKRDRAKTKVLPMSAFGIIQITRQRMRPSLEKAIYADCPHCKGAGLVKTPESMALDVMRRLAIASSDARVVRVELSANPDVAFHLLNKKRQSLADLETHSGKRILIRADGNLGLDEIRFSLFDAREGFVILEELGMSTNDIPHATQLSGGKQQAGGRRRGGRDERRFRGGRPLPSSFTKNVDDEDDDESHELDRSESLADQRDDTPEEHENLRGDRRRQDDRALPAPAATVRGPIAGAQPATIGSRGPRIVRIDPDPGEHVDDEQADADVSPPDEPGEGDAYYPPAAQGEQTGEGGGGRRRRRRRRRGRGRGPGGDNAQQPGNAIGSPAAPAAMAYGDVNAAGEPGGDDDFAEDPEDHRANQLAHALTPEQQLQMRENRNAGGGRGRNRGKQNRFDSRRNAGGGQRNNAGPFRGNANGNTAGGNAQRGPGNAQRGNPSRDNRNGGGRTPYYDQGRRPDGSFENVGELDVVEFDEDVQPFPSRHPPTPQQGGPRLPAGGGDPAQPAGERQSGGQQPGEGGGRRRRRRRRGRGRGGQGQQPVGMPLPGDEGEIFEGEIVEGDGAERFADNRALPAPSRRDEDDDDSPVDQADGVVADEEVGIDATFDATAEAPAAAEEPAAPAPKRGRRAPAKSAPAKSARATTAATRRRKSAADTVPDPLIASVGGTPQGEAGDAAPPTAIKGRKRGGAAPARGKSRRGKAGDTIAEDADAAETLAAQDPRSSTSAANRLARSSTPPTPLALTGSADKHLADDEPADDPTPAPAPRSYVDLDAIPDDYD